jgi:hypothetical protein
MKRAMIAVAWLAACAADPGESSRPDTDWPEPECRISCEPAARWLHVSARGVAFSSLPGRDVTTRTLQVAIRRGDLDPEVAWTARSDQAWLQVTPSGMTGQPLLLTAAPAGLALDQQHLATVIVRSPDSTVQNEQRVRVGLWVGSTAPQDVTLPIFIPHIVADPVLPRFYTSTGGSDIVVYDAYRGVPIRTLAGVVGQGQAMMISDDGERLFIDDAAAGRTVALDPETGRELQRYEWADPASRGLVYARPAAHPILITGDGSAFDVETATKYASRLTGQMDASFALDELGNNIYVQSRSATFVELVRYHVDYVAHGRAPLSVRASQRVPRGIFGHGLCLSADGERVYAAEWANAGVSVLSAETLTHLALLDVAHAQTAMCSWNGLVFVGGDRQTRAYRADHRPAGQIDDLIARAHTMALSGDATRITGSTGDLQAGTFRIRSTPSP